MIITARHAAAVLQPGTPQIPSQPAPGRHTAQVLWPRPSTPRSSRRTRAIVAAGSSRTISTKKLSLVNPDTQAVSKSDRRYINFTGFPFPLGPLLERRTCKYEVEKGSIWTFEQEQSLAFSNVTTNTRMTVIKLSTGGLWVHAPVAPTRECIKLVKDLQSPVEHIVLPTFAYEHKVFLAPFARKFPEAQVWVAPGQWSWPINLPISLFGVFKSKILGREEEPWLDEIDFKVLDTGALARGLAEYVRFPEVAFFHRASKTILVTDSVICVPDSPPDVIRPANLLDAATDNLIVRLSMKLVSGVDISGYDLVDSVEDTVEARRKGWQRMSLQALFFGPDDLFEPSDTFASLSNRLLVSPIVRRLVFNKVPEAVRSWVGEIARDWQFRQVIPCHFAGPVAASPKDFEQAFDWLEAESADYMSEDQKTLASTERTGSDGPKLLRWLLSLKQNRAANKPADAFFEYSQADMKLLDGINDTLVSLGVFGKKR